MEREKQIYSGNLLDVDFFPVWKNGAKIPSRAPKTKPSTEEQKKYNANMAIKNFVRLINENFDNNDYLVVLTYDSAKAPANTEDARNDVRNFFRRYKTKRKSELKSVKAELKALPNTKVFGRQRKKLELKKKKLEAPFKYAYTIEKVKYQRGPFAGRDNYHFHIFITGGVDRNDVEKMWKDGTRVNCNRFQPDRFGPEPAARYMVKDPQGSKRFICSKNIVRPQNNRDNQNIKDGKISARTVEKLCKQRVDDKEYWEKRYKGYKFIRAFPRFNEYNGHWYLSVVMYKTDSTEPPRFNFDGWADVGW